MYHTHNYVVHTHVQVPVFRGKEVGGDCQRVHERAEGSDDAIVQFQPFAHYESTRHAA